MNKHIEIPKRDLGLGFLRELQEQAIRSAVSAADNLSIREIMIAVREELEKR